MLSARICHSLMLNCHTLDLDVCAPKRSKRIDIELNSERISVLIPFQYQYFYKSVFVNYLIPHYLDILQKACGLCRQ